MSFGDLTPAEAEAYRATVEADAPARLTALATLLVADGVSLDEFDGTPQSLVPLWRWFVSFGRAGFPSIANTAVPRTAAVESAEPEYARLQYSSEMIEDYMVEVAATCFRDLSWIVNPDRGFERFRRPTVQYWDDNGQRHFSEPIRHVSTYIRSVLRGDTRYEGAEFLATHYFRGPFACIPSTAERCRGLPRSASILAPLLKDAGADRLPTRLMQTREPFYTREAVPSALVMRQQKAAARSRDDEPAGDELVLAHKSANVETLEESVPLDAAGISALLTRLGFLNPAGEPPTAAGILAEEFTEFYLAEDAMATTMATGGQLRAVQLASINTTRKTWTALTTAFKKAGRPMGAKLAREDEFTPDEEY